MFHLQYADIPDGHSFHGTPRYYRNAKVALSWPLYTGTLHASLPQGTSLGLVQENWDYCSLNTIVQTSSL